MFSRAISLLIFCCSAALAIVGESIFSSETARANDLAPDSAGQMRTRSQCAAFGPGFIAVEGTNTCVWRGGHVRMEFGARPANGASAGLPAGATPAAVLSNGEEDADVSRGHLRLPDSEGYGATGILNR